jgi:hypothetical protein
VIVRLAWRSLLLHPIRTAVLAGGFGMGIAVMANLLGVADVVLEQSRAPALVGGGDLIVTGAAGRVTSARYVLWGALGTPPLSERVAVASPTRRSTVYLVQAGGTPTRLRARGGIPSLERALEDPETTASAVWQDAPGDEAWVAPDAREVFRALDRFHPIPDVHARANSWIEWLYFNGQAGSTRFYLTFLVGPVRESGRRVAGVRLQLDRGGRVANYGESAELDPADVLATAPELTIGRSRVRLDGGRYIVSFDLQGERREGGVRDRATGEVILTARRGHTLPPLEIAGARGWASGYVVPVMSGALDGAIKVGGDVVPLAGGTGYHDHNWGFWEGVSWQWGQVQHQGLSVLYGRVFPPADAADASRIPGFLAVIGPDGPLGHATRVTIEETIDPARDQPSRIVVRGRSSSLDVRLDITIEGAIRTSMVEGPLAGGLDFLQLRARYQVSGRAGDRPLDLVATGASETFRGR